MPLENRELGPGRHEFVAIERGSRAVGSDTVFEGTPVKDARGVAFFAHVYSTGGGGTEDLKLELWLVDPITENETFVAWMYTHQDGATGTKVWMIHPDILESNLGGQNERVALCLPGRFKLHAKVEQDGPIEYSVGGCYLP